jgi:hypothetical protein
MRVRGSARVRGSVRARVCPNEWGRDLGMGRKGVRKPRKIQAEGQRERERERERWPTAFLHATSLINILEKAIIERLPTISLSLSLSLSLILSAYPSPSAVLNDFYSLLVHNRIPCFIFYHQPILY